MSKFKLAAISAALVISAASCAPAYASLDTFIKHQTHNDY